MGEMNGFVFSITFILLFSALLISVPVDMQGQGDTPVLNSPVDPSLILGFDDYTNYSKASFVGVGTLTYSYSLGGFDWIITNLGSTFTLGAKKYWAGWLYLGWMNFVNFISPDNINLGTILSLEQIQNDAVNGTVRYNLLFVDDGNDAGALVFYWDTGDYDDCADAWLNSELYILHGVGIGTTPTANIVALLVGLLFLQLPDCPVLINALIATPLWSTIVFVLWFVIKETIPFV